MIKKLLWLVLAGLIVFPACSSEKKTSERDAKGKQESSSDSGTQSDSAPSAKGNQKEDAELAKQNRAALAQIKVLKNVCLMFKLTVGKFPTSLDDLSSQPEQMSKQAWGGPYLADPIPDDPWGQQYTFSVDESKDEVKITSLGADGKPDTEDDIRDTLQ